jgi:hypothetical protein
MEQYISYVESRKHMTQDRSKVQYSHFIWYTQQNYYTK